MTDATSDAPSAGVFPYRPRELAEVTSRKRAMSLTQLLDIADATYQRLMQEKTTPVDFAALARAFCLIDERIRIRKGIPLPGQFQPSLDPLLNAKRGKRAVIDLARREAFAESEAAQDLDTQPAGPSKRKFGGKRKQPSTPERPTPDGPTPEQPKTDARDEQGSNGS